MAQVKVQFNRGVEGATNIVDAGTEGTKVASGTTAQRGSTTGQFRFNTTTDLLNIIMAQNLKLLIHHQQLVQLMLQMLLQIVAVLKLL